MKVPMLWLRDYLSLEEDAAALAERLTFAGIEVEAIRTVGGTYEGLVAARVLRLSPHPSAAHLQRCEIHDGQRVRTVVCGAPNIREQALYAYAPPGAKLPSGDILSVRTVRAERSEGMLCAEDELGLSDDHSGLYELPGAPRPGTPLADILGPPETVLDVEITPNRPDCLCLLGIARELAALLGRPLKEPPDLLEEHAPSVDSWTRVDVRDSERCPRYTARVLSEVRIVPSPEAIRRRLRLAGIRPINHVVDATNFVMFECGQPLHAFDLDKLTEKRLVVRRASAGETLTTLDGRQHLLDPEALVIADAARPVALAGIMGGAESEINETTRIVLLESAHFAPEGIRRTARATGLSTESSYRFERRTDIGLTAWACRRAAALMTAWGKGIAAAGVIDHFPDPPATRIVRCRVRRLNDLLGLRVTASSLRKRLGSLGLKILSSEHGACRVEVPTRRPDLVREVDLIEEFARLHGLDRVPTAATRARVMPHADDRPTRARDRLQDRLAALGFREICTYSMVSPRLLDLLDPGARDRRVCLPHPISLDQSVLRSSLIPQMVETLGYNRARQIRSALLFEIGKVFLRGAGGRYDEQEHLAIGLMGPAGREMTDRRKPVSGEEAFLWIKGLLEECLRTLRARRTEFAEGEHPALEPGFTVEVLHEGQGIGWLGLVRREAAAAWRLADPVAVAECRTTPLLADIFTPPRVVPPAPYPPVVRDMALIVEAGVRHADIMGILRREAPPELERIELFDIFEGRELGAGRKSLAYTLQYRSSRRTLTDDEANAYHDRVKQALRAALRVEFREGR